jgi:hypothetical protein
VINIIGTQCKMIRACQQKTGHENDISSLLETAWGSGVYTRLYGA